jgi:methyl halide transferase
MADTQCCVTECERPLDKMYWDAQYKANATGWNLGEVPPPIKTYFDSVTNKDAVILIPGCGNTYEAEYLLQQGFTNITVIDIATTLVENLQQKFINNTNIKVVLGDFFEHNGSYDYIIEQTFFCALPPTMRQQYVYKMHQLLKLNGKLVGLLFNRTFDVSPPFGGSKAEYELLFKDAFYFNVIEDCKNSVPPRANTELFIELQKNNNVVVNLYNFEGFTCSGCVATVSEKYYAIDSDVLNVSVSSNFSEILLVSKKEIALEFLQEAIAYDAKYKIKKYKINK